MRYLHTMIRVKDLEASLHFYCTLLGLKEIRRKDSKQGRFTLVFLAADNDENAAQTQSAPLIELTYNWDTEEYSSGRNFGHLAYEVDNIYTLCQHLHNNGICINRPPRDGYMAFIKSPDGISIELLQKNKPLEKQEPWLSMPNTGSW